MEYTFATLSLRELTIATAEFLQITQGYALGKELHPTILKALDEHPTDLLFSISSSQPHVAADGVRVAYYRSRADLITGRVTTTTIGKYLKQSFPNVPDNQLRDIAATWTPDTFKFLTTGYEIVAAVQNSPKSCMRWDARTFDADNWQEHPYSCYAPENGWSLAVRISASNIEARCLCHDYKGKKIFVRSFGNTVSGENSHSQSDVALEAWLRDLGYERASHWHNKCQIETFGNTLWPYLDGSVDRVDSEGYITDCGEYLCDNTDGTADNEDDNPICDHCGDRYNAEDEGNSVGWDHDSQICDHCCHHYIYVKGRRGDEYYIRDQDAIYVSSQDQHYDPEYLDDNDIIELDNGEYERIDNATWVERHEAYYLNEDTVYTIRGEYELKEDCEHLHAGGWALREHDSVYYCCIACEWYCTDNNDPAPVMHEDGIANPINVKAELEAEGQLALDLT
jgi:hypothetical protein